jgi:hypothetical protein
MLVYDASDQVLHCITPLFSVLADSVIKRMCLQLFGAVACAVRAQSASDGKLRLCVETLRFRGLVVGEGMPLLL